MRAGGGGGGAIVLPARRRCSNTRYVYTAMKIGTPVNHSAAACVFSAAYEDSYHSYVRHVPDVVFAAKAHQLGI